MSKICDKCLWNDMECQIVLEDESCCNKFMEEVSQYDEEIVGQDLGDNKIILDEDTEDYVVGVNIKYEEPVKKEKVRKEKQFTRDAKGGSWVGNCLILKDSTEEYVIETKYEIDSNTGKELKIQVLKPGTLYKKDFFKKDLTV